MTDSLSREQKLINALLIFAHTVTLGDGFDSWNALDDALDEYDPGWGLLGANLYKAQRDGTHAFDGVLVRPEPGEVIGAVYTEGSAAPPTPIRSLAANELRNCARCEGKAGGCWRCNYTGLTSPASDKEER